MPPRIQQTNREHPGTLEPARVVRRLRRHLRLADAVLAATDALECALAEPTRRSLTPKWRRAELLTERGELFVLLRDDAAAEADFHSAGIAAAGHSSAIAVRAACGRIGLARFAGRL